VPEPVLLVTSPHYLSAYARDLRPLAACAAAFERARKDADVLIVGGGPAPFSMASLGSDGPTLAEAFGTPVMLVIRVSGDYDVDRAMLYNDVFGRRGLRVVGTVLNRVPAALLEKARGLYRPLLQDRGIAVLGIIPLRTEAACPTGREFVEVLGAEVLVGHENLGRPVEEVLVGAMTLESALSYFRRIPNKAVITGGDRADLALAALETSTSLLLLTGGYYPDVQVLARAGEKGVPVALVAMDTYRTIEGLRGLSRRLKANDPEGLRATRESVEAHCDLEALDRALGLP